jgi:hypothetical protein
VRDDVRTEVRTHVSEAETVDLAMLIATINTGSGLRSRSTRCRRQKQRPLQPNRHTAVGPASSTTRAGG